MVAVAGLDLGLWAATLLVDTLPGGTPPMLGDPLEEAPQGTALMGPAAVLGPFHGAGLAALCPHQEEDVLRGLRAGQLPGDCKLAVTDTHYHALTFA